MNNEKPHQQPQFDDTDRLAVDAIRMICCDMVEKANSGHPGGPMSLADFVYVLWTRFMEHDPTDPDWPNRDRFVLSGGHTSTIQYALLGLFGYLPPAEWQRFRQLGSLTPGHVEHELIGAETTTGPLGQGFANAVGMALAEQVLREKFGSEAVHHRTFVTIGDGDIQEGICYEAASLAGHLQLDRLTVFFDDNHIQIDGATDLTFSEDVGARFKAQGFQVLHIDGHDHVQIAEALESARTNTTQPTLIVGRTTIGKGLVSLEGSNKTHGAPLGPEEIRATKEKLGLPPDESFHVPHTVSERFAAARARLSGRGADWRARLASRPDHESLLERLSSQPTPTLPEALPEFAPEDGKVATRNASGAFLKAVADSVDCLIGGAADLAGSVQTAKFLSEMTGELGPKNPGGRVIHFGVREHAMTSICNGIALHGGFIPFCGTFLVFADYMKPAIRLAALMKLKTVFVLTHDSFFLGEDGPTHQPVDQLAMLRALPGLTVIRPADGNETVAAWRYALTCAEGPVALILTRQGVPSLGHTPESAFEAVHRGAVTLSGHDVKNPDLLLLATGSEVAPAQEAGERLRASGYAVRVVAMGSCERFEAQPEEYKNEVLPQSAPVRLVIEAAAGQGFERYAGPLGELHCFDRFGESAPAGVLAEKFGFTPEGIFKRAEALIRKTPARARALKESLSRF